MKKILYKRYDLQVDTPGAIVRTEVELDKFTSRVTGFQLCADRDDLLYMRGTLGVRLNSEEIYPEEYEAKLLQSGLAVSPDLRYAKVDRAPGNQKLNLHYRDQENPQAPFAAYRVSVYVRCEMLEDGAH